MNDGDRACPASTLKNTGSGTGEKTRHENEREIFGGIFAPKNADIAARGRTWTDESYICSIGTLPKVFTDFNNIRTDEVYVVLFTRHCIVLDIHKRKLPVFPIR